MTTGINQGKLGHREGDVLVALRNGTADTPEALYSDEGKMHVLPYFWNPNSLAWEVSTGGSTPGGNVNVTNFPSSYPVTGTFLTDAQLRAAPVPVSGTVSTTGLTDAELRATPVPMSLSGSVAVTGTFWQATQPISGSVAISNPGLTDTELRATAVPVAQPAATDWRSDLRRGQTTLFAAINASASGDNTLVAADATKKVKVLQYTLVGAGTVNVTFKSGAGTSLSGAVPLVANSGIASPFVAPGQGHLIETAVNQALVLNLSGAVAVTGHLTYILEA